jgi:hypothetical protein
MIVIMPKITFDHITYIDKKLPEESEYETSRLWFIKKYNPLSQYDWFVVRQISIFWYYNKNLGCEYNTVISRKIE